jgi:hypothetical protein
MVDGQGMQRSSKPDPFMDAIQEQLDYVTACEYAAGSLRTHEATAVCHRRCRPRVHDGRV